jgi:hypothetical protein
MNFLASLLSEDGTAAGVPQEALLSAVQGMVRHMRPTLSDAEEALRECEAGGYCQGATDLFLEDSLWVLTPKGIAQARQLR